MRIPIRKVFLYGILHTSFLIQWSMTLSFIKCIKSYWNIPYLRVWKCLTCGSQLPPYREFANGITQPWHVMQPWHLRSYVSKCNIFLPGSPYYLTPRQETSLTRKCHSLLAINMPRKVTPFKYDQLKNTPVMYTLIHF